MAILLDTYLDEGEYNVSVYLAGQKDRPVINQMVDVPSQQIFTIAATGNLDNLGLLVIPDKVSKSPSQNYSSVRVIHLSPNAPGVDILVDGDTLFEDISFGEGTDYVDLNPGTYNVNVVLNTDKSVVLPLKVTLNPDKIYTIYIIGNPPTLQAVQVVDGNTYACR